MGFPTQPAYVHDGDWNDVSRSHPAMKWMEEYTNNVFDKKRFSIPYSDWHSDDFTLHKPDNAIVAGGDKAWAEAANMFAVFTEHMHVPSFAVCFETKDGYDMLAQASMYLNLVGDPGPGEEKKVKDSRVGKSWDTVLPAGFHFSYVKDDNAPNGLGFLLKKA